MLSILDVNIASSIIILAITSMVLLFVRSNNQNMSYYVTTLGVFLTLASLALPSPMINIILPDLFPKAVSLRTIPIFELVMLTLLGLLAFKSSIFKEGIRNYSEYYALILFSLIGCLTLVSSYNLVIFYIGIEIISISAYGLTAINFKASSSEAAVKYFILGSVVSAFFLLGMALLYGATGALDFETVFAAKLSITGMFGAALVIVSLFFKIGFFPFHWWIPDVYSSAATSIVAFMSSAVKLAFIYALFKFVSLISTGGYERISWLIAILSIVFGNLLALRQRDLKKLLAYASISQMGYVLILLSDSGNNLTSIASFYTAIYGLISIAALAIISQVEKENSADISNFQGLLKTNPLAGIVLSFCLLSFAGVPPAIGGFVAKFVVFSTALSQGLFGITIVALFSAVLASFYYFRLISLICFLPAGENRSPISLTVPITCCVLSLILGFYVLAGI